MNRKRWGDALKLVRTARKQTQTTIAAGAEISVGHLGEIEAGRRVPSVSTLEALCDELWLSFATLATIAENPEDALGIDPDRRIPGHRIAGIAGSQRTDCGRPCARDGEHEGPCIRAKRHLGKCVPHLAAAS